MIVSSDDLARELLEVVPLIMRTIRGEMRRRRTASLTVPQFRAMMFLNHNPGASLLNVARHLGLTSPTVSKMVDGLVDEKLVRRQESSQDRRKVLLGLTSQGRVMLEQARKGTQTRLAEILSSLTAQEREINLRGMKRLQAVFSTNTIQKKIDVG
jgi:DNA-binding MarR family transcriptional regulator